AVGTNALARRPLRFIDMRFRKTALAAAIAGTVILFPASAPGDGHQRKAATPSTVGPLVGADSLDNFPIGGPQRGAFAYRFRAPWTGTITSVKFFAILNTEERPKGYSGGTGGRFRVSLVPDVDG